ncbi:unnamed protein product [Adineta steineri]|uniref:TIR domain-containing protein n=1 Tax=Adineta steineri TaxID=433720 RepID=A0A815CQH5_9BILA|nr:unnamed protein product [Adineta steineri]CAF3622832.1 unnamed protein product [Adineta steineri]
MGCGASNNVAADDSQQVPNAAVKSTSSRSLQEDQRKQQTTERVSAAPQASTTASTSNTMNVLISCHTNQQEIAEQIKSNLSKHRFTCYIINETTPESIVARANLIRWCNVFIVNISRMYQQTAFCMETINYAKDVRKPVITIYAESNFQPYGALGAISASTIQSIVLTNEGVSENIIAQLSNAISSQENKKNTGKNVTDPEKIKTDNNSVNLIYNDKPCTVLICTTDEGLPVAKLIYNEFSAKNLNALVENLSDANATCSVRQCTVFIPILSAGFEKKPACRVAFEEARQLQIPIIPVMSAIDWKPQDWLGITVAGATYFRIYTQVSAYKPLYDSNRITDLRVAVEIACQPRPSQAEREQTEMKILKEKIEECKSKLQTWPPQRKVRTINSTTDRQPVRVTIAEPNATLAFNHIHHTITRMDIKAPPPILDEYGLPKRVQLDCMISYQWGNQTFVRTVYEDMLMREVKAWFDIYGSMQGNTNDAMATGVECAKVMLVFLSKSYVESTNCQLEFRYAVKRGKAFVIIRTQPNIQMEKWMTEAIQGFPQYNAFSYDDLERPINGVPTIDAIVQAIRTLAQAQPTETIDDCSAELFELRSLLDDARDALYNDAGQTRYKTCTRCNQQFDEFTKGGCKKHRAYYMGGTILEGRWVCCRQQAKDSPGCEPCDHTDAVRVYTQNPDYGTWTWEPA